MMTDKERIHRWITQADLERMLDEAWHQGFCAGSDAMREAAAKHCESVSDSDGRWFGKAIRALPLPEDKL
jgi:hypothetical protein